MTQRITTMNVVLHALCFLIVLAAMHLVLWLIFGNPGAAFVATIVCLCIPRVGINILLWSMCLHLLLFRYRWQRQVS